MKKMHPIAWAILCLPVVYFAMVTASVYIPGENIFALLERISTMVRRPDLLRWTAYTPRFLLVFLLLYGGGVLLYYADHENRRPGEEYGSAKWGNARELNKRYADQNGKNVILTKRVSIGLDGYKHRRNLNILVVGGSGSGKTRFFCKPGIMSVNCSYLIVDPKGEMLRSTGYLLKDEGYDIKVFDLIHPRQSDGYNPFTYIRDDPDVLKLMDNLVKNTTPPKGASNDPFWEKAEIALDSALMLYLLYEAPVEEQNFEMLMFMLECARVMEEDEQYQSPLDLLFQTLEERDPSHIAVREYKVYKQAAGKTAKSILVTASVRLAAFIFPQYAAMMQTDEMDFPSLGERKRAIFCVIPVNDGSMNYLVSMLLTQCFQQLYLRADERYNGRLPVPVRVIQDEWANVAQPDSYPKVLATCRSYNIGINIIVQNIQSIKALYKDEWEGIIGNCDTLLFLGGGNEPTSLEFVSKLLGKETVHTRTRGQTKGRSGSSSVNYQQTGRDLMTPDEIRMLPTNDALLFIRGEKPVRDKKYDIKKHPNVRRTADGRAKPYSHNPPVPDYTLPDLPYEFRTLDDYTFLEDEYENEET
ncbi:MAG: type IV secretory system conjugative DNA transfer family protein [Clostridiales bacterium]|nr:type IV secretory system conjugative DNA transfer family protein [Clostridiales bacterium]MBD9225530.1 type IV secretory system conjugative DNA transfer family protein [Clostridiales bacterium]